MARSDPSPADPADLLVLNPATRLLWRSSDEVQLELGCAAVVVDGLGPERVRELTAREAGRGLRSETMSPSALAAVLEGSLLWPAAPTTAPDAVDDRRSPPAPRLGAELTALSAQHGPRAATLLAERAQRIVQIDGASRTAALVGALLAASGVGRVCMSATDDVRLHHTLPGGLLPSDEGRRFAEAAGDAVRRFAAQVDTGPLGIGERPDLVLLAHDQPVDHDRRAGLHRAQQPHLVVRLAAGHGIVGPLVLPGRSSCLSCADLHRRDRDPAWPALAVQLTVPPPAGTPSEAAPAALIAALAAEQALAHLDGLAVATVGGTVELHRPDWRLRRRSWPTHPRCDCGASHRTSARARETRSAEWSV